MAITERGKAGGEGQTMDYTIVHGQTVSKYRCETICLKDFEVVTSWRGDVAGLEINFLTHSQNLASASKIYSLK